MLDQSKGNSHSNKAGFCSPVVLIINLLVVECSYIQEQ